MFKSGDSSITDEDIETILQIGKKRTETNKRFKQIGTCNFIFLRNPGNTVWFLSRTFTEHNKRFCGSFN